MCFVCPRALRDRAIRFPETEVTGGFEPPDMALGVTLRSSGGTVSSESLRPLYSQAFSFLKILYYIVVCACMPWPSWRGQRIASGVSSSQMAPGD